VNPFSCSRRAVRPPCICFANGLGWNGVSSDGPRGRATPVVRLLGASRTCFPLRDVLRHGVRVSGMSDRVEVGGRRPSLIPGSVSGSGGRLTHFPGNLVQGRRWCSARAAIWWVWIPGLPDRNWYRGGSVCPGGDCLPGPGDSHPGGDARLCECAGAKFLVAAVGHIGNPTASRLWGYAMGLAPWPGSASACVAYGRLPDRAGAGDAAVPGTVFIIVAYLVVRAISAPAHVICRVRDPVPQDIRVPRSAGSGAGVFRSRWSGAVGVADRGGGHGPPIGWLRWGFDVCLRGGLRGKARSSTGRGPRVVRSCAVSRGLCPRLVRRDGYPRSGEPGVPAAFPVAMGRFVPESPPNGRLAGCAGLLCARKVPRPARLQGRV